MECRNIIMNYSMPPSLEDIETIAENVFENLPDEVLRHCEEVVLSIENFVDDCTMDDVDIDDPFELLALYKSGKEIAPGIQKKAANEDDTLILYRRAILDMWCETEDDLEVVIRQVMIEEIGRAFDLREDDIRSMIDDI